jgi:transcriptional repressor BetI
MPKVGQEPIRRQQMIEATMACIREEGVNRATMQRIAKRAGLTSGLIVHYFTDKAGLFEAVYRELYRAHQDQIQKRLVKAKTPAERLNALLDAQLCDEMLQPDVTATWIALYALVPDSPVLARLERAYERRLQSNLLSMLQDIGLSRGEANNVAEELMSLLDGLWFNVANRIGITPAKARAILRRYISIRIPIIH